MEVLLLISLLSGALLLSVVVAVFVTNNRTSRILDNQINIKHDVEYLKKMSFEITSRLKSLKYAPENEKRIQPESKTKLPEKPLKQPEKKAKNTHPILAKPLEVPTIEKPRPVQNTGLTPKPVQPITNPEPTVVIQQSMTVKKPQTSTQPGKVAKAINEIKEWLIVGDKYRAEGVSKEYAVATNWLARIGIIIAVLGIGFGLRYSIQHGWIAPALRVTMTTIVGIAMIFVGLKLDGKKYELLGHGLLGGGITTLYFSIYSATHFYNLIDPTTGMLQMALLTGACGIIATKFNSKLVAVLGIIGGYATPIMMSTATANLPVLYAYMLLIGIGVLGITTSKNWYLVQFLGFVCHWTLFVGSLFKYYNTSHFTIVISFLCLFFILFSFNSCAYHLVKKIKSTVIEVTMLILNSSLFAVIGYLLIFNYTNSNRKCAILTLSLAALYTICSHIILNLRNKDRGLVLTFIGLSAFYTTISLPLLLDAGWLSISWSLQALLMLWLSCKLNSRFLKSLSYLLYIITLISLMNTFGNLYQPHRQRIYSSLPPALYFKQLLRHLMQIGIPTFSFFMARKVITSNPEQSALAVDDENDVTENFLPSTNAVSTLMQTVFVIFLVVISLIETHNFFQLFYLPLQAPAITTIFVGLLLYICQKSKRDTSDVFTVLTIVVALTLIGKVVFFDLLKTWQLQQNFIYASGYLARDSFMRLLNFSLVSFSTIYCLRLFRSQRQSIELINLSGALSLIVPFIFLTLELNTFLHQVQPGFRSGGISILWSLYAIAMLAYGIKKQKSVLRYSGLSLFAIIILKVFSHDLADLDELWRIIAFIILGSIIFLGSFLYIRFQHLFTINAEEKTK